MDEPQFSMTVFKQGEQVRRKPIYTIVDIKGSKIYGLDMSNPQAGIEVLSPLEIEHVKQTNQVSIVEEPEPIRVVSDIRIENGQTVIEYAWIPVVTPE